MKRHPRLFLRTSCIVKRFREEATEEGLRIFLWEVTKNFIKRNMIPDRVFNMDETGFAQKCKSKVIAVHGSQNVWSKMVDASFHLTLVAAYNEKGVFIPPLFIVPSMQLNRDVLNMCEVTNSTVTTAPKGLMNSGVFIKWITFFAGSVPGTVKRPILLVYNGYGSHYNEETVQKAI